jgi:hypothetical protein
MLELVLLVLFVGVPWVLGYGTARYWAALVPAGALLVAVLSFAAAPAPGEYPDEVDAWAGLWIVFSGLAVVVCLAGAAVRRRSRRRT